MRMTSCVILPAAILLSTAAVAETKAPAETDKSSTVKVAPVGSKICKRLETTGTRIIERTCLTMDEWKKVEEQK